MRGRNRLLIALGVIAAILIGIRLALPTLVTRAVNRQLHSLEAYDGRIRDVDLALWRGAYRIEGIQLVRKGGERPIPFLNCERMDLSIQWRALLHGSLTAELVFFAPQVNLVRADAKEESQLGTEEDWPDKLQRLFPFKFNSIQVKNGVVTFTAPGIRTQDAIELTQLNGWVTNLTNVADSPGESFAQFKFEGRVLGEAPVGVTGTMNPLAKQPTFEVDLTMRGIELPKLNPWLREYVKADAESGNFELYLEAAAAEGRFEGYAKPLMRHVDMYRVGESEDNPLKRAWEGLLDFATNVLENEEENQLGARVPFEGQLENPDAGVLEAIISVLRNGFIRAFARSLEGSITLRDVRRDLREMGEGADDSNSDSETGEARAKDEERGDS